MPALVIAEHDKTHLRGGTQNAITAAAKMGGDVHVLVAGSGARAAADEAAKLAGVSKVLHVAALLDVSQVSEISGVESPDTFVRPIYAGNAFATVQSSDAIKVVTVRATGFEPAAATGNASVESASAGPD